MAHPTTASKLTDLLEQNKTGSGTHGINVCLFFYNSLHVLYMQYQKVKKYIPISKLPGDWMLFTTLLFTFFQQRSQGRVEEAKGTLQTLRGDAYAEEKIQEATKGHVEVLLVSDDIMPGLLCIPRFV